MRYLRKAVCSTICSDVIVAFRGISPHEPTFSTVCHRDPIESVRQMKLEAEEPRGDRRTASTTIKGHKGIEGLTLVELSAKWGAVVTALERIGVTVTNPDHALEGALSIRYSSPP